MTTSYQPRTYTDESDIQMDLSVFEPITINSGDDFLRDLTQEWDERHKQTTKFFRRVSFSEKFGLFAMPPTPGKLSELSKQPDHIPFDEVFLASNALSPTPIEMGGALILENDQYCLFSGELDRLPILVQVLKKFRGNQDYFLYQITSHQKYTVPGIATLLRYSCDTKHLVLVYEHLDFGPLSTLITVNHKLPKLTWAARVQIIYDLASTVHDLHLKHRQAHLNITSQNIFLTRHYQCKIGDFGHRPFSKEFDYIDDIHGIGKIITELYFDLSSMVNQFEQMVEKVKKSGSDLTSFLKHRHDLLCDVDNKSLLGFLELAKFCLLCDFTIESKEVYQKITEFYEEQTTLSTVMV